MPSAQVPDQSWRGVRSFLGDERGGATFEFVLMSLPLIVIGFVVVQFMLLAHASIVIKSAAHAAARSALVNKCIDTSLVEGFNNPVAVVGAFMNGCDDAPEKWEDAARMALIPISASNEKSEARQNDGCQYPDALVSYLQQDGVRSSLQDALHHKACYAFEDANSQIEVEWVGQLGDFGIQLVEGPPPMRATVSFRVPLLAPTRKIFNSGERGDNSSYWTGEATVELL
ncbi:MAG: TadE/TadG family type IV pilus assembly protein [Paracoccaceae bacterium]